ncbi:hypothetical protein Taro_040322, partial [Colocasia esculenta]|nr:hypothetical protein [Colocasia esculenta]
LNVNQATREYLERYVDKKTEREKLNESEAKASEKENGSTSAMEKQEPTLSAVDNSEENGGESGDKERQDNAQTFGIVNDEDRDADKDALEKLTSMIEERLKNKPLPPPPPMDNATDPAKSNSEAPSKSRDGDSDVDIMKNDAGEDRKEEEMTSDAKLTADHERYETGSSDRARRRDRSRERDRERDLKREKERELERYERDRERERVRREREREMKIREAERLYKDHVKEWEAREREKESQRQREIEREKERARERRREIKDQENESDDDDTRKRRHRSSVLEEKRRKRQREKEEDLLDRLREEEEIAEAKRRAIEEHNKQKEETNSSDQVNEKRHDLIPEEGFFAEDDGHPVAQPDDDDNAGDGTLPNGNGDEIPTELTTGSDVKQGNNVSSRKLGFGLMASGKRATVPSVFHEEDDEDTEKEKKMRPLVPIDYSTEELQAVQATPSGTPPNLVAAAEFAKRITSVNPKEEKPDMERERSKRSSDRTSHRERNRDDEEYTRIRDDNRDKSHDKIPHRGREQEDKVKTVENKKLLDAKQLIDMIPKTKEKLFAYEINWEVYDKHELHERMRPWISKKITEFLGEEEATLVDYIVSSTREHVHASQMLELLQSILDDEAEMFVLKMWRMLIFEIKKVETGLNMKSKEMERVRETHAGAHHPWLLPPHDRSIERGEQSPPFQSSPRCTEVS